MWLLNWLLERYQRVQDFFEKWWQRATVVFDLLWALLLYLLVNAFAAIKDWIDVWRAASRVIAVAWFDSISYWVGAARANVKDWIDNWRAASRLIATTWYKGLDWLVNTAQDALKDFKDHWLAGAKIIATTWYSGVDYIVNVAKPPLKDFIDLWLAGAKIIATTWYSGVDYLVNTAKPPIKDFIDTWLAGAKLISTAWRSVIDWYVNIINNLIRDFVENWINGAKWLSTEGFPTLLDLIQNLYDTLSTLARTYSGPIVSFIDDPVNWFIGILESIIWRWAEWFLAFLLGGVIFEVPPRPVFGGGTLPGNPPGGPGPGGQGLIWPCDNHRISGYSFHNPPTHNGIDIGAGGGSPIWSIRAGTVTAAGWSSSGYGYYCDIQHDSGWWSRYGHFKGVYVHAGQAVTQGQTVGLCDSTGNSTGDHLHLEIKYNGSYVDPLSVLG